MYQPEHFVETRREVMHSLIERFPLGLLVCVGDNGPVANHLPFTLHPDRSENGYLYAHMARANPAWRIIEERPDIPVLAVFQGPQAYVSPGWYETKKETGKVVPTWNYAVVQARGTATIIDDPEWLHGQVSHLTETHEASRAAPWAVSDAPERYIDVQLRGIVGLEIEITELSGKWKASQNRSSADRAGVARGLAASDPAMARLVGEDGSK